MDSQKVEPCGFGGLYGVVYLASESRNTKGWLMTEVFTMSVWE